MNLIVNNINNIQGNLLIVEISYFDGYKKCKNIFCLKIDSSNNEMLILLAELPNNANIGTILRNATGKVSSRH